MTPLFKDATGGNPFTDVLNVIKRCLRERTPLNGKDIEWDRTPDGFRPVLKAIQAKGGKAKLSFYELVQVKANVLECYPYNAATGTSSGSLVKVAKPFHLMRDSWSTATVTDGFTSWTKATIDGAEYTVVQSSGSPFVNDDANTHTGRRKKQVTLPVFGITNPFIANVEWLEVVYPTYVQRGNGKDPALGEIIAAFDLESPITFPARSYKYATSGDTADSGEFTVSKMELPFRHWVPNHRPIIICETSAGVTIQRRVMIPASESFPI